MRAQGRRGAAAVPFPVDQEPARSSTSGCEFPFAVCESSRRSSWYYAVVIYVGGFLAAGGRASHAVIPTIEAHEQSLVNASSGAADLDRSLPDYRASSGLPAQPAPARRALPATGSHHLDRLERACRSAMAVTAPVARASYSISRSTGSSTFAEGTMPSSLAVLLLTTNSRRVDCSTGMSAGLVPLRILSQ